MISVATFIANKAIINIVDSLIPTLSTLYYSNSNFSDLSEIKDPEFPYKLSITEALISDVKKKNIDSKSINLVVNKLEKTIENLHNLINNITTISVNHVKYNYFAYWRKPYYFINNIDLIQQFKYERKQLDSNYLLLISFLQLKI